MSLSTSSAALDADTFPKSCSSTDTTPTLTSSITEQYSWRSKNTYEHRHRIHAAISHRLGVCPGAFRTRGQRSDPCAESFHRPHGSNHLQGGDYCEPSFPILARGSECQPLCRVQGNESH